MTKQLTSTAVGTLLLCSIFVGACGGGDSDSPTAQAACDSDAKARCDRISRCTADFQIVRDFGSYNKCIAVQAASCMESIARPKSGVTPAYRANCAKLIAAQSCGDWFEGVDPECGPVKGPIADGQPCVSGNQCASTFCSIAANTLCGTCKPPKVVGDACSDTDPCGGDFRCEVSDPATGASTCVAPRRAGAACLRSGKPCAAGYSCVVPVGATDGTCVRRVTAVGEPCNRREETGPTCDARLGLYCPRAATTCVKTELGEGGKCNIDTDNKEYFCADDGSCVRPLDPTTNTRPTLGTCQAAAPVGGTCYRNTADGPGCVSGAVCILEVDAPSGTCRIRESQACNVN